MTFTIEHETSGSMRVRLAGKKPSKRTAEAIRTLLIHTPGIRDAEVFRASGGLVVRHDMKRADLIKILKELDPETIREVKREMEAVKQELLERLQQIQDPHVLEAALQNHRVDAKELSTRKLDPALKRRMRLRILLEAGADLLLPAPVQAAYHAWQMVTLKSF